MSKLTQKQKVLRHLVNYGKISPLTAFRDYGIMRLASRIHELRNDGHNIKSVSTTALNRFKEKINHATYFINNEN